MNSSENQSFVANLTDLGLSAGTVTEFQNVRLIAASVIVFVLSVPLSLLSLTGALKWTVKKNATIINYITVYYTFGTVLNCFAAQISVLLRAIAWYTDRINVSLTCGVAHVSTLLGGSSFNFGLTAVILMRYIFVLRPMMVTKFKRIKNATMASMALLVACFVTALGTADCYFNNNSAYKLCTGTFTSSTQGVTHKFLASYLLPVFLFPIVVDLYMIVRILHRSKNTVVVLTRTQNKQQNLLTLKGSILCRMITLFPYFSVVTTLYIVPFNLSSFDEYSYFHSLVLCCFVTDSIILPLCTIINSPFIKSEILQFCCKRKSERSNQMHLEDTNHGIHMG